MSEQTHFKEFVDYVIGDNESEMGKTKAELSYALHCLEREIAICSQTQARNDALVKALRDIRFIAENPIGLTERTHIRKICNAALTPPPETTEPGA